MKSKKLWTEGAAWAGRRRGGRKWSTSRCRTTKYALPAYYIVGRLPRQRQSRALYVACVYGLARARPARSAKVRRNTAPKVFATREVRRRVSDRHLCALARLLRDAYYLSHAQKSSYDDQERILRIASQGINGDLTAGNRGGGVRIGEKRAPSGRDCISNDIFYVDGETMGGAAGHSPCPAGKRGMLQGLPARLQTDRAFRLTKDLLFSLGEVSSRRPVFHTGAGVVDGRISAPSLFG